MTANQGEYEKREEPVTFRTSEKKAAWLRDCARSRGIDCSFLVYEITSEWLENKDCVRTRAYTQRGTEDLEKALETAASALRVLMVARGKLIGKKERRTA